MRRIWSRYSIERDIVLFQARREVPRKTKSGELAKVPSVFYVCAACKEQFKLTEVQVDHIDEVGTTPQTWKDWGNWLDRLFCSLTNLQVLCIPCHKKKTLAFRRKLAKLED